MQADIDIASTPHCRNRDITFRSTERMYLFHITRSVLLNVSKTRPACVRNERTRTWFGFTTP